MLFSYLKNDLVIMIETMIEMVWGKEQQFRNSK